MLLASLCSPFPPVANRVDLPVSSPVEFWVAVPSSPCPLLTECIQISLSNIRSSYVKNKSKQTSKGRNEEGCCSARRGFGQRSQTASSSDAAVDLIIVFTPLLLLLPLAPGDPLHQQNGSGPFGANPNPKPGL